MESGWFKLGSGWGNRGWVSSHNFCFFSCPFAFCSVTYSVHSLWWQEHDHCCVCFSAFSLFSLSLVPLTRSYWCIKIAVSLVLNYFKSQISCNYSLDFLGKRESVLISIIFSGAYSIHHHYTSRLTFQLANLLSLSILLPCFYAGNPLRAKTLSS